MRVIAFLLVLSVVSQHFWGFVGGFALAGLLYFVWLVVLELRINTADDAARRAALIARADQQHAWVMAGDPRGTYGEPDVD